MERACNEDMRQVDSNYQDSYSAVYSLRWDAEDAISEAVGQRAMPRHPFIVAFCEKTTPMSLSHAARVRQLELLDSGELVHAMQALGKLLDMPEEYAAPLLEDIVRPFESETLRT
jgi:hypothetical protein